MTEPRTIEQLAVSRPKRVRPKASKGSASPTQLTLKLLRKLGYPLVEVTERWNQWARIRQDLFGIVDVLAVGKDVLAVQTTSWDNVASRVAKIAESEATPHLRAAGVRIVVHGWRKDFRGRWEHREVDCS